MLFSAIPGVYELNLPARGYRQRTFARCSRMAPLEVICRSTPTGLRGAMHKLKLLLIGTIVAIALGAAMIHMLTGILIAG
jgi:hypothetical protein